MGGGGGGVGGERGGRGRGELEGRGELWEIKRGGEGGNEKRKIMKRKRERMIIKREINLWHPVVEQDIGKAAAQRRGSSM